MVSSISDKVKEKLMIHKGPVRCLCVSKDGSLLISGSSDQTIAITNVLSTPDVDRYLKITESDSGKMNRSGGGFSMSDQSEMKFFVIFCP
jgi:WD40 repeat protein